MSAGKGYSFSVSPARNAQLIEAQRKAAVANYREERIRYDQLLSDYRALVAATGLFETDFRDDAAPELKSDALAADADNGHRDLLQRAQALRSLMGRIKAHQSVLNLVRDRVSRGSPASLPDKWVSEVSDKAQRLLARLDFPVDQAVREQLVALAAGEIRRTAGQQQYKFTLDSLRAQIDEGRNAYMRAQTELARIRLLCTGLDPFCDPDSRLYLPDAAEMARQLRSATALTPERRQQAEQVLETARRHAEAQYALPVIAEALTALGYDIGDAFETLVPGETGLLLLPGQSAHGVQISLSGDNTLATELVRLEGAYADPAADRNAEEKWCSDYRMAIATSEKLHLTGTLRSVSPQGREGSASGLRAVSARKSKSRKNQPRAMHAPTGEGE